MTNFNLHKEAERKAQRQSVLFWLFVGIFSVTALFAFAGLAIVFGWLPPPQQYNTFVKFAWALWTILLAQVVGGVIAHHKDTFGLSSRRVAADTRNRLTELIDYLDQHGLMTPREITTLREDYADMLGVAGTVRGRGN